MIATPTALRVRRVGALAHCALEGAGLRLRRLPGYASSPYWTAGETPVWIGTAIHSMHPRAIVLDRTFDTGAAEWVNLESPLPPPWHAPALRTLSFPRRLLDALLEAARSAGAPRGFGAWLLQAPMDPFVESARPAADRFARACVSDRVSVALREAESLLGRGTGLTPSGDDFVGGAVFARRHAAPPQGQREWAASIGAFTALALRRSHALSAVLLTDLLQGRSYLALHRLMRAVHAGAPDELRACASEVVGIGHNSGWDLLAGCIAGLRGPSTPSQSAIPRHEPCALH